MKKYFINDTGIEVSCIGLGTVKFGRDKNVKYPIPFEIPNQKTLAQLLAEAKELGINLVDTAPAYGTSEERLGQLLKNQRYDWVISTKVGEEFSQGDSFFDFSKSNIIKSIDRSLQRLQTDYLDVVLVHSNGEDEKIINDHEVFDVLQRVKESGKLRAFGMSTKTIAGGKLAVKYSDIAMVTFNPIENADREVVQYAMDEHKSIFVKKALASGHIENFKGQDPVVTALSFIFENFSKLSVIMGTIQINHLKHNVECANKIWKFI